MSRHAVKTLRLPILTPEHVAIDFHVADVGSRATAVLIDLAIQFGVLIGLSMVLGTWSLVASDVAPAVLLIVAFVLRNFYFTFSEIRWQGRTIGKKAVGLRVVARDGGPLSADLLFARNLTRELETFLPLSALMAPESLLPDAPSWAQFATVLWIAALTLLPLFNRQRARLGDLLAGTVVVFEPQAELDVDLVEEDRVQGPVEDYAFTSEQLDVYGIRELQVLEDVL
ncbi:MAG: RDD family protein, partial [Thermoanaerobaculia bacterium]